MILAIDSGNTNIVFAVFDDLGKIVGKWRTSTNSNRTADEFGIWLNQLMRLAQINIAQIEETIIATVVPATLFSLKTLCRNYFNSEPIVVGEKNVKLGINIHVDNPGEVGADRLANAVAANEIYSTPLIIIDFGTATTFDVINKEGGYEGGVIAPGINLSLEALHQTAAQLPRVAVCRPKSVIGKNTIDAMISGIFWGYIGLIEGLVSRIQTEFQSSNIGVISTGGLAPLFSDHCKIIKIVDSNLTLYGLYSIFRRNQL